MSQPFHLSFVVPDLKAAKDFYIETLGCDIGRDHDDWIDILFFGHQLTIHQQSDKMPAFTINHFGPVLDKSTWIAVANRCKSKRIEFQLPPTVTNEGTESESGKFMIQDPAGNVLEFKYYNSFSSVVSTSAT